MPPSEPSYESGKHAFRSLAIEAILSRTLWTQGRKLLLSRPSAP